MDGGCRGTCPGSGVGSGDGDRVSIDRAMMMRFRPIAPKPADGDQFSNKSLLLAGIRTKRKYVRVKNRGRSDNGVDRGIGKEVPFHSEDKATVTLQLLPGDCESAKGIEGNHESTNQHDALRSCSSSVGASMFSNPSPISNPSPNLTPNPYPSLVDIDTARVQPQFMNMMSMDRPIESWVIVESVGTPLYPDVLELGYTDESRAASLWASTSPGFVSDLCNRVQWVNGAYEGMVRKRFGAGLVDVVVRLVVKDELPGRCGAFTCSVRVQDTWREERRSMVVPCDVWRMDFGGFAWRLDVEAALSIGLHSQII